MRMQVRNLFAQLTQPFESGDLNEMRRGMIFEIAVVIFVLAWFFLVSAYDHPEQLAVAFLLLACSLGSIWLRQDHYSLALPWLVATLLAALAVQKWIYPASDAQYYFPIVVVVSSLLVSGINVFIVAAVASATVLGIAHAQGADWFDNKQVVAPIALTLMTASAAWIGSHQIHLALDWMRKSYARASELLEQLRDERASLARTLRMLEDAYLRIEKMNYALIEARSGAETARQLKAEFAANISHELRTPLNLIIGFSETMANAPETYGGVAWSPALRGDIEQIYQSSRHLASLIDDILDLSALEAQRLGLILQDAALEEVIDGAVALMHDLYHAKNLDLNVECDPGLPRVRMDVTRVRQVLINLLTNASRFTYHGGVTIRAQRIGDDIRIAVRDTGMGIASQDIPKVFEEFGQVDGSTTRQHEGSGLGVPLSKRLVESHGGQMWLESQPGIGTTFYFTLPIMPSGSVGRVTTTTRATRATYRKAVLVYEPDPVLLRTLRRQLSNYDVLALGDHDDARALVAEHQPIALIANAQETRTFTVPDDLPILRVALSGNVRAAQALGVQDYLIKPVLREQLLEAIANMERTARNVLIVDDDPQIVELLARMLQSAEENYRPIKSFGGEDALTRLRNESVDLVLLDLQMPEMNGMALLREMKNDPGLANVPVIVVSAQQPEATHPEGGLRVELSRQSDASTTETLSYLQALLATLPLRGLPTTTDAPA
ncbi:MAG: response regulator [Chloroflexi bacterium]|nr:response regulator [Chloroflexota bacterium]